MKSSVVPFAALLFIAGCAASRPGAETPRSAAEEDAAAAAEDRTAALHTAAFDSRAVSYKRRCLGRPDVDGVALGECWFDQMNPTANELDIAREHRRAAAEHRAVSRALRDAEAQACVGVSEHDRDVSPFAHRKDIVRVTELPDGAAVLFRPLPAMTAASLQRIVDCHLARNDALGHQVPWMLYCPLVPRDVTAKVTEQPGGLEVVDATPDTDAAREVRYRVGALITPDRAASSSRPVE